MSVKEDVGDGDKLGVYRTIPWLYEIGVDPRRWNVGGSEGTWSRCICWMF